MQQWEYLVVYIHSPEINAVAAEQGVGGHLQADKYTEQLNHYASSGWELMHFEYDGDQGARAVFKRTKG
jgi:hypothetical protein